MDKGGRGVPGPTRGARSNGPQHKFNSSGCLLPNLWQAYLKVQLVQSLCTEKRLHVDSFHEQLHQLVIVFDERVKQSVV